MFINRSVTIESALWAIRYWMTVCLKSEFVWLSTIHWSSCLTMLDRPYVAGAFTIRNFRHSSKLPSTQNLTGNWPKDPDQLKYFIGWSKCGHNGCWACMNTYNMHQDVTQSPNPTTHCYPRHPALDYMNQTFAVPSSVIAKTLHQAWWSWTSTGRQINSVARPYYTPYKFLND